jgi:hypothetical protein
MFAIWTRQDFQELCLSGNQSKLVADGEEENTEQWEEAVEMRGPLVLSEDNI